MDEKYCLFDILESEKNMGVNMAIALNEASNDTLYKKLFKMFESISESSKRLFTIAYNNNWYKLENAEEIKICAEIKKLKKELE